MQYKCMKCHKRYDIAPERIKCTCGAALWLDYQGKLKKEDIIQSDFTMWRYSKAYPVKKEDVKITYNESITPLTTLNYLGRTIKVKQDHLMPTGSFKDRGAVMVTNFLNNLGVKKFTEDSSGNGGSAFAGYCALGDIDIKIFVPAGTSAGKIAQMKVYGAELIEVEGTREDVATAAMKNVEGSMYAGHNWHPLFVQGVKSVAYEIWEQNHFEAPDYIVCPIGNGSMVSGIYIGFKELLDSGETKKMPKIMAVQADHCNPFYRAFVNDDSDFQPKKTIAEGISIKKSTKHEEVLAFVKETNGTFVSVSESEIKKSLFEIGKKGLYIEPTSAATFAGLKQLINDGSIEEEASIVTIVSGNGLKATTKILGFMEEEK